MARPGNITKPPRGIYLQRQATIGTPEALRAPEYRDDQKQLQQRHIPCEPV